MTALQLLLSMAFCLGALPALAEGTRFPQVDDAATVKECSACHIVFPPQMLPARSWQAILNGLDNHFGEDASIADQDRRSIIAYLTAHGADGPATKGGARYTKGLAADATLLRITETPYWLRKHDEISPARFKSPQVKSAANCGACHQGADKGVFIEPEDD